MYNWIQLISAAGFGAIIIKFLDIVWLQKVIDKAENKKWLREQKIKAFSELAETLLSIGLTEKQDIGNNPYEFFAIASKSLLLIENEKLQIKINSFIVDWDRLINEKLENDDSNKLYLKLVEDSKLLVNELKNDLMI